MRMNDYQDKAMSYRLETSTTMYALLNLSGEVGELHSLLAKRIRDGHVAKQPDFNELLGKELGDILWTLAAIAQDYGWTLSELAEMNIEKLESRKQRNVLTGSGDTR
jgi:NTP pyrophosphatase (non-canonical NTP hydrolase)